MIANAQDDLGMLEAQNSGRWVDLGLEIHWKMVLAWA
jgi:hypothetical protein